MDSLSLSQRQLHEFISENLYPTKPGREFIARCIDGRPLSPDRTFSIDDWDVIKYN